jgi:hypothetical protein
MRNQLLILGAFLGLVVLSGFLIFNSLKKVITEANVSVTAVDNIQ